MPSFDEWYGHAYLLLYYPLSSASFRQTYPNDSCAHKSVQTLGVVHCTHQKTLMPVIRAIDLTLNISRSFLSQSFWCRLLPADGSNRRLKPSAPIIAKCASLSIASEWVGLPSTPLLPVRLLSKSKKQLSCLPVLVAAYFCSTKRLPSSSRIRFQASAAAPFPQS